MNNDDPMLKKLDALLERIKKNHPEQAAVVDAFAPLARFRTSPRGEKNNGKRRSRPFTAETLPVDRDRALRIMTGTAEALSRGFPGAAPLLEKAAAAIARRPSPIRKLCLAAVNGRRDELSTFAARNGLEEGEDVLFLLLYQTGRALAAQAAHGREGRIRETEPYLCPVCGSRPELSVISGQEGSRRLHCGLCGHVWRYSRTACALCGTDKAQNITLLYDEAIPAERAERCESCGGYLLSVDARGLDVLPELLPFLALGMGHLDALAQKDARRLAPLGQRVPAKGTGH